MNYFNKQLPFYSIIVALFLLCGCISEDNNESIEDNIINEQLSITSFDMLSKNHSFSVIKSNIAQVDSLVVCLFPNSVDFSALSPKISYKGDVLEYRINNGSFNIYAEDIAENINYSYPNTVDFKITNSANSNSKIYRIIVDLEQPIIFNTSEISIPDTSINTNYNGLEVDTWQNIGNYPIRLTLRTNKYVDIVTPETATNNIFSTTLTNASNFIKPTEKAYVNVFTSNPTAIGTYKATALFNIYFNENLGYLVYDDSNTSEYIKNIGYKPAELKLKGDIIN